MTMHVPKRHRELQALIDLACDGLLTKSQRARLNEILRENPAAVDFYVAYLRVEGMVAWDFGQPNPAPGEAPQHADEAAQAVAPNRLEQLRAGLALLGITKPTPVSLLTAALVVALMVTTLAFLAPPYFRGLQQANHEEHGTPRKIIARLIKSYDAQWAEGQVGTTEMAYLMTGHQMNLLQGVVQVDFNSGASVLLQGPAQFELVGELAGDLKRGKLTARISPAAKGFRIDTPLAPVVDLGTEFGVAVDQSNLEVYVFAGQVVVEKSPRLATRQVLHTGDELRLTSSSAVVKHGRSSGGAQFVAHKHFETPQRWKAHREALLSDPSLVAYYEFEQHSTEPYRVVNLGAGGSQLDGLRYGTHWTQGRWTDKGALAFGGPASGDYVDLGDASAEQLNFDGPFSIAAWFRVKSVRGFYPAIVTKGDSAWRMHVGAEKGDLGFGTNPASPPDLFSATKVADGRWHFGVAVFEPQGTGYVKQLYVDGKLDATTPMSEKLDHNSFHVLVGENGQQSGREFHGLIDELAIFRRALSAAEVQKYFQVGNPYDAVVSSKPKSSDSNDH